MLINSLLQISADEIFGLIRLIMLFIDIPVLLASYEYRITKKDSKRGLHFMWGTFISSLLLGIYSLFLGVIVMIVYFVTKNITKANANG